MEFQQLNGIFTEANFTDQPREQRLPQMLAVELALLRLESSIVSLPPWHRLVTAIGGMT